MFASVPVCWICGGQALVPFHQCRFDFSGYAVQDPELHRYTDQKVWLVRCKSCGFGQPDRVPTLPRFFDRMYDQRWSQEWVEHEFEAGYKDVIFASILRALDRRVPKGARRLLDVGAHAGRFMHLAQRAGWIVEGIELNPTTASCASRRTGAPVHRLDARQLEVEGRRFAAVTLTDVLEHVPEPIQLLRHLSGLLDSGGAIAVKVPCGPAQWRKERWRTRLRPSHEVSLASNLVHVSHFSPVSLARALERAGFADAEIFAGAPELLPANGRPVRRLASNALRLGVYGAALLPGGLRTPLALNLQAYARKA